MTAAQEEAPPSFGSPPRCTLTCATRPMHSAQQPAAALPQSYEEGVKKMVSWWVLFSQGSRPQSGRRAQQHARTK